MAHGGKIESVMAALLDEITEALSQHGLEILGAFNPADPDAPDNALLIGNAGQAMWQVFSKSSEYFDGDLNPMDRWSARVIGEIAERYHAKAYYPFEQPYQPFQQWAKQATGARASPLGMLIHSEFGLWQAFRGALVFERSIESPKISALFSKHPCDTCRDKPCLSACPVNAFDGNSFNVAACRDYLPSERGQACMMGGCKARNACPIGTEYRYSDEQIRFHMAAFGG